MKTTLKATLTLAALTALTAQAQSTTLPMTAPQAERCATRLSIALVGKAAPSALLTNTNPQSQVDAMLQSADFQERFARFVNASFNDDPGAMASEDSAYWLSKYILQNNRPWEELFLGQYKVDVAAGQAATSNQVVVTADPNGMGYFRSRPWLLRYAGNEEDGIKIATAYRMMNNAIGLRLVASTNAPGADISATGREAAGCRACHYDGWFALDKVSNVLSRKITTTQNGMQVISFGPPPATPQDVLGGIIVKDDKELMTALVKSEAFQFRACRMAFEYLYGRAEQTCEGPVFDKCMDAFKAQGTIQSALAAVAKDASFCQ
jgi:hypothetical protein